MTDTPVEAMEPCPFCGSAPDEAVPETSRGEWEIGCPSNWGKRQPGDCNVAPAATGKTREEAAANWNRRALSTHPQAPAVAAWIEYADNGNCKRFTTDPLVAGLWTEEGASLVPLSPGEGWVAHPQAHVGSLDAAAERICLATGLDWDELPEKAENGSTEDREWFRMLARAALSTLVSAPPVSAGELVEELETKQEYAVLYKQKLPPVSAGDVPLYDRVCISDPNNPGARIVGFRIREGDEAWGELGLSEPLSWLDRLVLTAAALTTANADRDRIASKVTNLEALIDAQHGDVVARTAKLLYEKDDALAAFARKLEEATKFVEAADRVIAKQRRELEEARELAVKLEMNDAVMARLSGECRAALDSADRLATELEWYGEQARLCRLIHSGGDAGRNALADDGGKRARTALKGDA